MTVAADETPPTVRCTDAEALPNLTAVLQLCAAGRLTCSPTTRRPSAATVRAVAEVLVAGDFYPGEAIASFAWPLLLQAGGLARLNGSRLELTPAGRKALGRPAHEVIRNLWARWPQHAPIDEFSRVEQIKGQRSAAALSAAGPRRRVVAGALALCPPEEWVGVDDLFGRISSHGPGFSMARSERGLWKLYIVDAEYGSFGYAGYSDWPLLEGRYALAVLFEYAATLGLIDVEYVPPEGARDDYHHQWGADYLPALSRYDGLVSVRLNRLGRYAIGLATAYTPAAPERGLQVLPNLDIVAVGDLSPADRLVLDSFAGRTADRIWTVSANSLLAAVDAGRVPGELHGFLADRALHGVPEALLRLIADVEARAGQVRDLGVRRVLECADAQVATLLERDRSLRGLCTRVGERHLLLDPAGEEKARAALRRHGYPLGPGTS